MHSTLVAALLGVLAGLPALYLFTTPMQQERAAARSGQAAGNTANLIEGWPICTSMGDLAEGPAWAPLDPDFVAGKRALAAGDWNAVIAALTPLALRDDRNADVQNYLGYAYRRLQQLEPAMRHYRQAIALNPRHRSAHEHLGEAHLVLGESAKAEEQLVALEGICLIACVEYDDLKRVIAAYKNLATVAEAGLPHFDVSAW